VTDLAGQRVVHRLKGGGTGKRGTTATATGHTHAPLPPTVETWYDEVRAHDTEGNRSAGGRDRAATTTDRRVTAVPHRPAVTDPSEKGGPGTGRTAASGVASGVASHEAHRTTSEKGSSSGIRGTGQDPYRDATAERAVPYYSYYSGQSPTTGRRPLLLGDGRVRRRQPSRCLEPVTRSSRPERAKGPGGR
jgi:hypothetical protein